MATARTKLKESDDVEQTPAAGLSFDSLSDDSIMALEELGASGGFVIVERRSETGWAYLDRVMAAEFTIEYVKSVYGGGTYRARVIDKEKGALNPFTFNIDSRFTGRSPLPATNGNGTGNGNHHSDEGSFRDRLLEVLLLKVLSPQPAPVVPQREERDPFDLAIRIAELVKPQQSQHPGGFGEALSIIQEGMKIGERITNPNADNGGWVGAVKEMAPAVVALLNHKKENPAPVVSDTQSSANNNPPVRQPAPVVVVEAQVAEWIRPLLPFRSQILAAADKQSDPALYATLFQDALSDMQWDMLGASHEAGSVLAEILVAFPELNSSAPRQQFTKRIVVLLSEMLEPEEALDDKELE